MSLLQTHPPQIEFVKVPAGEFVMGIDAKDTPEAPAHRVNLADYYIGKYPVTNAQYLHFVLDTGHHVPATWLNGNYPTHRADHPVGGLTWMDADLFCAWLRHKTGKPFHLPTEAQWEKAASWNPHTNRKTHFPWGNDYQPGRCNLFVQASDKPQPPSIAHGLMVHGPIVNFDMHLANDEVRTTPVGHFSPGGDSPYGCADLIGNVEEWCHTAMWDYPYRADDGREEQTASGQRCLRGGDWYTFIPQSGLRRSAPSDAWVPLWGLRVALSSEIENASRSFRAGIDTQVRQARENFQAILRSDPTSAQLYYDWGSLLFRVLNNGLDQYLPEMEQSFTKAIDLYEKSKTAGLKLSTENPMTVPPNYLYFNRALARGKLDDYNGAYADMSRSLSMDGKDVDGYLMRVEYACELKNYAQAEQDFQLAQQLQPEPSYRKSMLEARLLEGKGEWENANQAYTNLLVTNLFSNQPYPKIYLWRANTFRQLGQQERAISDYYHYFLLHPEDVKIAGIVQRAQKWLAEQGRNN